MITNLLEEKHTTLMFMLQPELAPQHCPALHPCSLDPLTEHAGAACPKASLLCSNPHLEAVCFELINNHHPSLQGNWT